MILGGGGGGGGSSAVKIVGAFGSRAQQERTSNSSIFVLPPLKSAHEFRSAQRRRHDTNYWPGLPGGLTPPEAPGDFCPGALALFPVHDS